MKYLAGDLRAFVASVRREFRSTRRYPMTLVGSLFWPVLLPAVWVLVGRVYSGNDPRAVAAFAERAGTSEVAGFVFVGFAMYMWLSVFLWGPGTLLRQEQVRGTLESIFLTPASRLVVIFGPPIAHIWPVLVQFTVMTVAMRVLFGVAVPLDAVARALAVIVVTIPSMYAIASLFSLFVLRWGEVGPLVQFVRGALVLLSGITFPVLMLPAWAQAVATVLPPTYIVADIRRVLLTKAGLDSVAADLVMVIALASIMALLAVLVYGWIERSARRTGMLGAY